MGVLLPYVVAPVAVALIFSDLFGDKYGLVNHLLGFVGIDPIAWHTEVLPSHVAIATMVNWRWTGYNALILLAAMQAIPRESTRRPIDRRRRTRPPVLLDHGPELRPTIIFVIITSTIGGLQIFDEPRMFDQYRPAAAPTAQWHDDRPSTSTSSAGRRRTSAARPRSPGSCSSSSSSIGVINFLVTRRIVVRHVATKRMKVSR